MNLPKVFLWSVTGGIAYYALKLWLNSEEGGGGGTYLDEDPELELDDRLGYQRPEYNIRESTYH